MAGHADRSTDHLSRLDHNYLAVDRRLRQRLGYPSICQEKAGGCGFAERWKQCLGEQSVGTPPYYYSINFNTCREKHIELPDLVVQNARTKVGLP
jgi:hypothetical protein